MNAKMLLAAGALVIGLNVPAVAGSVGCKPGNAFANTKATDCRQQYPLSSTYSMGSPLTIAPSVYAYAPAPYAYAYDPYPYTYQPHIPVAGVHAGPFGLSLWAH